ncbi:hypothetical protein M3694_07180 [Kocuria marina]|uniref:hypothetical protein n=1 Tax=Kocuria marina TaxID=223184 RepID=UPI002989D29A|nr:hypothetical protein [Kocuria marina]MCT2361515.1 hypothetical protein [Kocuria marina]
MDSQREEDQHDAVAAALGGTGTAVLTSVAGSYLPPEAAEVFNSIGDPVVQAALTYATLQYVRYTAKDDPGRERVLDAATSAANILRDALAGDKTLRDDGFFPSPTATRLEKNAKRRRGERRLGTQLAEGVLLAAKNTFEDKKAAHLGYFYAFVALEPQIDAGLASWLLAQAEALTWTQYVLLASLDPETEAGLPLGSLSGSLDGYPNWGTREQLEDLISRGFVVEREELTERLQLSLKSEQYTDLLLTRRGSVFTSAFNLQLIEPMEIRSVTNLLMNHD